MHHRRLGVFAILGLALVGIFVVLGVGRPEETRAQEAEEAELLALINDYRVQNGLDALAPSDALYNAAEGHSADMSSAGVLTHTGPYDGSSSSERMSAAGYDWSSAAENVAWGQDTPAEVLLAWQTSASHNEALLGDYSDAGIGHVGEYWTLDLGCCVGAAAEAVPEEAETQYAAPEGEQLVAALDAPEGKPVQGEAPGQYATDQYRDEQYADDLAQYAGQAGPASEETEADSPVFAAQYEEAEEPAPKAAGEETEPGTTASEEPVDAVEEAAETKPESAGTAAPTDEMPATEAEPAEELQASAAQEQYDRLLEALEEALAGLAGEDELEGEPEAQEEKGATASGSEYSEEVAEEETRSPAPPAAEEEPVAETDTVRAVAGAAIYEEEEAVAASEGEAEEPQTEEQGTEKESRHDAESPQGGGEESVVGITVLPDTGGMDSASLR